MGNTCVPQKGLRFKNFVVAVYPDDTGGSPVPDALGKLENYVASNPERIPRVCRKISKLQNMYLNRRKLHRVVVGVQMLRELIAHSDDVNGFVPHSIDICSTLLSNSTAEYRIGAADVMTILCYKLAGRADGEQSCRLITDSKDKLLPPLEKMCLENICSNDLTAQRCRYAALVALSNIIFCLHGVLTDLVDRILTPFLYNLYNILCVGRKITQFPIDPNVLLQQRGYDIVKGPFDSVELPDDPVEREMAFIDASSWGIGAVGGCVSTARVKNFLQLIGEFITSHNAWLPKAFSSLVFLSLVRAMERRQQRIGYSVCQFLCSLGLSGNQDQQRGEGGCKNVKAVQKGIIHALILCTSEVRMVGGRPQVIFDVVRSVGSAAGPEMAGLCHELMLSLIHATYKWRNAPQLHLLLVGLLNLLQEDLTQDAEGALRALAATVSYVRVIPLGERSDINVVEVIAPFLLVHDEMQGYAAQVLSTLIAGVPAEVVGDDVCNDCADAATSLPLPPLFTEMRDIATAKSWVLSVVGSGKPVTPLCVVGVSEVVWAVLQSCGSQALPFSLSVVYTLQTIGSTEKSSTELHLAWAHLSLVVLSNCGTVCGLPRLTNYGLELLQQRLQVNELSPHFTSCLTDKTICVLRLANNAQSSGARQGKQQQLLRSSPADGPKVTCRINFDVVSEMIANDASADVIGFFGGSQTSVGGVSATIAEVCFSGNTHVDVPLSLSPRRRTRGGHSFTLGATGSQPEHKFRELITVSVADGGASPVLAAVDAASKGVSPGKTAACRIVSLLARHNVDAATQLLKSSACVKEFPLEINGKEEKGGMLPSLVVYGTSEEQLTRHSLPPAPPGPVVLRQTLRADDNGFYAYGLNSLATTDTIRLRAGARADRDGDGAADWSMDQLGAVDVWMSPPGKSGVASWGVGLSAARYIHLF